MNIDDLDKINKKINGVKYEPDETNSGTKDTWYTPKEFYENGSGDCEDFAIAKYFQLKSMGYDPEDMRISHVNLTRNKGEQGTLLTDNTASGEGNESEAHMVLVVNGMVLDNMTSDIKSLDERKDLAMVYQFNEDNLYQNDKVLSSADKIVKWNELLARVDEEDMIDDYEGEE
jgi:predicted transglutaminase-like cysteine proteinase